MALKKSFSFNGLDISNGYVKVIQVSGAKENMEFSAAYKIDANNNPLVYKNFNFVPDLQGSNFIAQAYNYLKTLPEFDGAVDC